MVPEAGFHILEIMDVPVVLVQRVLDERLVARLHAHPEHEVGRHEQRVRPALAGEVVVLRHRVLEHPVGEPQRLRPQVVDLARHELPVALISRGLVQRDQAVAHGALVHGPRLRQPQLDELVDARPQKLQVFPLPGCLVSPADPIVGHTAGPVPRHIHPHSALHDMVDLFLDLRTVKNQSVHRSFCSFSSCSALRP